jgi:hypothetical protein
VRGALDLFAHDLAGQRSCAHGINQGVMPDLRKSYAENDCYFVEAANPETGVARNRQACENRHPAPDANE